MIKQIPNGKAIVLNGKNNDKDVQLEIATSNYTHVFTSPEIALSKQFKKNILNVARFTTRFCLLTIDKIHFIEQWGDSFWPQYAKIGKVQK